MPVAIEYPKHSIMLVCNLDHQCIRTSTNVHISCKFSEVENCQLLEIIFATNILSKSVACLVLVLAFLGGPRVARERQRIGVWDRVVRTV